MLTGLLRSDCIRRLVASFGLSLLKSCPIHLCTSRSCIVGAKAGLDACIRAHREADDTRKPWFQPGVSAVPPDGICSLPITPPLLGPASNSSCPHPESRTVISQTVVSACWQTELLRGSHIELYISFLFDREAAPDARLKAACCRLQCCS
jgi:hypothetical protein